MLKTPSGPPRCAPRSLAGAPEGDLAADLGAGEAPTWPAAPSETGPEPGPVGHDYTRWSWR